MEWRDMSAKWSYRGFVGKPASRRLLPGSGRTWLREFGLGLVTLGFVVLLFAAYELVGTNLSEEHSQATLAREFASALANGRSAGKSSDNTTSAAAAPHRGVTGPPRIARVGATGQPNGASHPGLSAHTTLHLGQQSSPAGDILAGAPLPVPPPGGALDHLVIPAIGLSRYVVQGVDETDLQMGPGHYPGTPLPGQPGNVGIAGHRTTFGAPFFRLNEVSRGDLILLTDTSGTTWVYGVLRMWVVDPGDTGVLDPTRASMLTLTTCNPRFEATSRLVVRAALLERVPRGAKVPSKAAGVINVRTTSGGAGLPGGATTIGANPAATSVTKEPSPPGKTTNSPRGATAGDGAGEGSPTVGPTSAPVTRTADANGSGGGGWAWPATIGFTLLALLAWVADRVLAARLPRYSKLMVLVAGAVVCLVPLWFAFEHLVDLLPTNI
jgi:LPXTG-site transpeptidase (sortase) family protein